MVFGISNPYNICYFNSLFQLLLSSDKFIDANIKYGKSNSMLKELLTNAKKHDTLNFEKYMWLIRTLQVKTGISNQCADEYFLYLMDRLTKKVNDQFKCKLNIRRACNKCNYKLDKNEDVITLEYINGSFTTQSSDGGKCAAKSCAGNITVVYNIVETSNILYIVNQQFDKQYDPPDKLTVCKKQYKLVGYVVHSGSVHGGHYTCTARRDGKFYRFNDSVVSELSPGDIFKKHEHKRIIIFELV